VGSIDPKVGTLRGSHWPEAVAKVIGTRLADAILASGSPQKQAGHMDATDRKPKPLALARGGPSTYGNRLRIERAPKQRPGAPI